MRQLPVRLWAAIHLPTFRTITYFARDILKTIDSSEPATVQATIKGFYPFIHLLRGIAPLIVVWSHLAFLFLYERKIADWEPAQIWWSYFVIPLRLYLHAGHLGVVVFFFVSGFIITYASLRETRYEFAIKRVFRIFPVLGVALLLAFSVRLIAATLNIGTLPGLQSSTPVEYIQSFFLLDMLIGYPQALPVTWTLTTEIFFYVLTFAFLSMSKRDAAVATYWMIAVWVVISMVEGGAASLSHLRTYSDFVGLLLIGRIVYLADSGVVGWRKCAPMLLLVVTLFVAFYMSTKPGGLTYEKMEPAFTYLYGFGIFTAAMTLAPHRIPRFFAFLADISLSLYLLHLPVGMFAVALLHAQGVPFTLAFLAGTAISILASWAAFWCVELPSQRFARRLVHGLKL